MQIAPHFLPVRKDLKYGGVERIISDLDAQFIKQGQDSFIVATGNSDVSGKLCPTFSHNTLILKENKEGWKYEEAGTNNLIFEEHCLKALGYVEKIKPHIIHDHTGFIQSQAFRNSKNNTPILCTLHGPLNDNNKKRFRVLGESTYTRNVFFNAVSKSQKEDFDEVMSVDFLVYHSVNLNEFPFQEKGEGYIFSLGLIADYKGQDVALDIAKAIGRKIIIAGPIHESVPKMKSYWGNEIKPRVERFEEDVPFDQVQSFVDWFMNSKYNSAYVGELDDLQKKEWYKRAKVFYHPTQIREAFGLVMIESMACGTPVIAYNRGPVKEIIDHGKTGYIVNDIRDFCDYTLQINKISRERCRQHVKNKFSLEKGIKSYLSIYETIISKPFLASN